MRATPQTKARRTGLTGRGRVRRNLWPFDSFATSTTYHVKRSRGPATAGAGTFKGHRIEKRPDGGFVVPSIDRESIFDDKRQAKRFITAQTKNNGRKNGRPVMTYELAHAAATDAANKAMRKAGRTSWSTADYNLAARTFKKLFKTNSGNRKFFGASSWRKTVKKTKTARRKSGMKDWNFPSRQKQLWKATGETPTKAVKRKTKNAGTLARKKKPAKKNSGAARRNSVEAAEDVYKKFHGRPHSKTLKVTEPVHYHKALSGIGDLHSLCVRHVGGRKKTDLDFGRGVVLAQNEKRNQLFIRGGDQSVPLGVFGVEKPYHEQEILGDVLSVDYYTRKDHLAPEDGGEATYRHKFGRKKPVLIYSTPDKLLTFAGGGYTIPNEGIDL